MTKLLGAEDFRQPAIVLSGPVDYDMYAAFRRGLEQSPSKGLVVITLSTLGGDPEVARMMGEDVRFHSDLDTVILSSSEKRRSTLLARPSCHFSPETTAI